MSATVLRDFHDGGVVKVDKASVEKFSIAPWHTCRFAAGVPKADIECVNEFVLDIFMTVGLQRASGCAMYSYAKKLIPPNTR